jgi:hypothetical protein
MRRKRTSRRTTAGFWIRPGTDPHDRAAGRAAPPESGRSDPVRAGGNHLRLEDRVPVAGLALGLILAADVAGYSRLMGEGPNADCAAS